MKTTTQMVTCWKCNGTGQLPAFKRIANGVCFRCDGTGKAEASEMKPRGWKPVPHVEATVTVAGETLTLACSASHAHEVAVWGVNFYGESEQQGAVFFTDAGIVYSIGAKRLFRELPSDDCRALLRAARKLSRQMEAA